MKIKNLAFFGVMAAILGVGVNAHADTAATTTVIASQAYVDAVAETKQNNLGGTVDGASTAGKAVIATDTAGSVQYRTIATDASDAQSTDLLTAGAINSAITAAVPAASNYVSQTITNGTTDKAPSEDAVYDALATKQDTLSFDSTPTANSTNPVTSGGVKTALDTKQDTLTFDSTPTASSTNPVTSGGVKTALDTKQDTLTFDSTPTADSGNPVTSGGVKTALDAKQGNLGGSGQNGKVVTATENAGTVTYTSIDGAVTANSTNLVTSGAVAEAIGDANSAVTNAYANNALTREGLEAASNLAKMAAVQDTIARQGSLEKAWSDEFDSTAATTANATNLYNATTNRATNQNATPDNYVPTVAAVEKRVKSAIDEAVNTASASAASTYQTKSDSNVASDGNYITAGQGVGANLVALDTRAKTNADNIATNTTNIATNTTNIATNTASITTLNGDVNTAGSVLKAIKDNAETATFTPGDSGLTSTNLADAIKEVKTTAASGLAGLDVSDTATNQPVTAVNQTDGAIAVTRGTISYAQGLKYDLSNINSQGGDGSSACVQDSPCTLTMFMNGSTPVYEWTNMDTADTDAVI